MKHKLTHISDIPAYYRFCKATVNGHKGYMYYLCDKLTPEQKDTLIINYNNILLMKGIKNYAPEITYSVLFVSNKVIKQNEN